MRHDSIHFSQKWKEASNSPASPILRTSFSAQYSISMFKYQIWFNIFYFVQEVLYFIIYKFGGVYLDLDSEFVLSVLPYI